MKAYLIAALLVLGLSPALAQETIFGAAETAVTAADTKAQQALDTQSALEGRVADLEGTVAAQAGVIADQAAAIASLETAVEQLQDSPATWPASGIFYLNAMGGGTGNACSTTVGVGVECLPDITDLEGDDLDVNVLCTSGSHDGTTYTATEVGTHTCMFMASDPRWSYATHNSVVTVTVKP